MIISFAASQSGTTKFQMRQLRSYFQKLKISQLNIRDEKGPDQEAVLIALELGVKLFHLFPSNLSSKRAYIFPEDLRKYKWLPGTSDSKVRYQLNPIEAAYKRNEKLVSSCQVLIAAPKEFKFEARSSVWNCVRRAWTTKKEVIIIPPKLDDDELEENLNV